MKKYSVELSKINNGFIFRKDGIIEAVEAELNLENKDFKKTPKLTWLADTEKAPFIPCICVYYDNIISKAVLGKDEDFKNYIGHQTETKVTMLGDPELANVKQSEIIQLQRRGFFICDEPYKPHRYCCKLCLNQIAKIFLNELLLGNDVIIIFSF